MTEIERAVTLTKAHMAKLNATFFEAYLSHAKNYEELRHACREAIDFLKQEEKQFLALVAAHDPERN